MCFCSSVQAFARLHFFADLRLPSDSTSRWTSLPSANTFYCRGRSGLSPPSCCPCRARWFDKRPKMDSLFGYNVPAPAILLRARLATAEEVTAQRNLAFTPTGKSHQQPANLRPNTKIGGTETQRIITIKRTLKDLQFLYLFLPGKLMASTARLSFFYRHHNAYRIQEMPNHNSSTWENESELIHCFWMNQN